MKAIAGLIDLALRSEDEAEHARIRTEAAELAHAFPLYGNA
jgi:hypothetical protein